MQRYRDVVANLRAPSTFNYVVPYPRQPLERPSVPPPSDLSLFLLSSGCAVEDLKLSCSSVSVSVRRPRVYEDSSAVEPIWATSNSWPVVPGGGWRVLYTVRGYI